MPLLVCNRGDSPDFSPPATSTLPKKPRRCLRSFQYVMVPRMQVYILRYSEASSMLSPWRLGLGTSTAILTSRRVFKSSVAEMQFQSCHLLCPSSSPVLPLFHTLRTTWSLAEFLNLTLALLIIHSFFSLGFLTNNSSRESSRNCSFQDGIY